ncbi:polysaccharide pyruvyl transferase family protein [Caballeronia sp. LZ034LL]|uniref:polysaccharide pyruvyl transferase family protein n=1 Tax=Caballeronia sp. LZ034LL TaxID=3038567 RepID=UPI002858F541|nr:polysaccharide pyruvyl transferase family protein [Caballeronia sp. LZ034LL]MDR5837681.1 polysaccharide pyruvyl transferase family protein [Caballeronia sp. LZ034LL]
MKRVILFGAFDRHNAGDMLFAHVVARLLTQRMPAIELVFAGLAQRDLRGCGGHRVTALAEAAARWRDEPVTVIHAGGELLTCDAWQAAVMLTEPGEAQRWIARLEARDDERRAWVRSMLGIDACAPYVVGRETFPHAASIVCNAVGGVKLESLAPALRAEVLDKLRGADVLTVLTVRDARTQAALRLAGIEARLIPDPVSLIAALFDERIQAHANCGELAALRGALPQGYLAVQFSADFGDDATLARIARQLDRLAEACCRSIVLFRAGAAPWHDDLAVYERTVRRMNCRTVKIFASLNVWDICALIAMSEGYAGSSLHGRIIAMAYGLPRMNMRHGEAEKQRAYASAWDEANVGVEPVEDLCDAMLEALKSDREALAQHAATLAQAYQQAFDDLSRYG